MMASVNPETLNNNVLESTEINYKNEKGFPKIIDIAEDEKGNTYLKAFLLNDKINKNYWSIPNEYIRKYATGFIGQPLIAYPGWDHPDYEKEDENVKQAGIETPANETEVQQAKRIQDGFKV